MSVYLIDYENVHAGGLAGVDECGMDDEIILLYGNDTSTISMELHIQIASSKAKVQYHKIERTGKNYLDFQLSTIAGYLVGTTRQSEFVIVSKDSGFDAVLDFWNMQKMEDRQLHFSRRESIGGPDEKRDKEKTVRKRRTSRPKNTRKNAANAAGATDAQNAQNVAVSAAELEAAEMPETAAKQTPESKEQQAAREKQVPQKEKQAAREKRVSQKEKQAAQEKQVPQEEKQVSQEEKQVSQEQAAPEKKESRSQEDKQQENKPQESRQEKQSAAAETKQLPAVKKEPVEVTESVKKKIRAAVKGLGLKPTDYTKIYKICKKSEDKQDLHQNLVHSLKQEKGTQIYKAIVGIVF